MMTDLDVSQSELFRSRGTTMRYKLAPCGCLTDAESFVLALCPQHQQVSLDLHGAGSNHEHRWQYSIDDDRTHCLVCGLVKSARPASNANITLDMDKK